MSSFQYGTGLGGATQPGQRVTAGNIGELPPGSVVRNGDGSRIIHLHDEVWLWCKNGAWMYDHVDGMERRLDEKSVLCHLAPMPQGCRDCESAKEVLRGIQQMADEDLRLGNHPLQTSLHQIEADARTALELTTTAHHPAVVIGTPPVK